MSAVNTTDAVVIGASTVCLSKICYNEFHKNVDSSGYSNPHAYSVGKEQRRFRFVRTSLKCQRYNLQKWGGIFC